MKQNRSIQPTEPKRIKAFALYFRSYMGISSFVVAALPLPVTLLKLIPIYAAHRGFFSAYTSMFCFLILGFIFYSRHKLARIMFQELFSKHYRVSGNGKKFRLISLNSLAKASRRFIRILPLLLIIISLSCVFGYHQAIEARINAGIEDSELWNYLERFATKSVKDSGGEAKFLLRFTPLNKIADSWLLIALYFGIFLSAETAFLLMALKEYLQDKLKLSDMDIIKGPKENK